jgi:hypothetical protein
MDHQDHPTFPLPSTNDPHVTYIPSAIRHQDDQSTSLDFEQLDNTIPAPAPVTAPALAAAPPALVAAPPALVAAPAPALVPAFPFQVAAPQQQGNDNQHSHLLGSLIIDVVFMHLATSQGRAPILDAQAAQEIEQELLHARGVQYPAREIARIGLRVAHALNNPVLQQILTKYLRIIISFFFFFFELKLMWLYRDAVN